MSKLIDTDFVYCSSCSTKMNELRVCDTRSFESDSDPIAMRRCHNIICQYCKICMFCKYRLRELEDRLTRDKYPQLRWLTGNKKTNCTLQCKNTIDCLKREFNVIYELP